MGCFSKRLLDATLSQLDGDRSARFAGQRQAVGITLSEDVAEGSFAARFRDAADQLDRFPFRKTLCGIWPISQIDGRLMTVPPIIHMPAATSVPRIAAGRGERTVQIWDVEAAKQLREIDTVLDVGGLRLALSPNREVCIRRLMEKRKARRDLRLRREHWRGAVASPGHWSHTGAVFLRRGWPRLVRNRGCSSPVPRSPKQAPPLNLSGGQKRSAIVATAGSNS